MMTYRTLGFLPLISDFLVGLAVCREDRRVFWHRPIFRRTRILHKTGARTSLCLKCGKAGAKFANQGGAREGLITVNNLVVITNNLLGLLVGRQMCSFGMAGSFIRK